MSSAKAALEADTRVLAYEAGRAYQVRVNTISAGPLGSRAAKAIGFIDDMIRYSCVCLPFGAFPNHAHVVIVLAAKAFCCWYADVGEGFKSFPPSGMMLRTSLLPVRAS